MRVLPFLCLVLLLAVSSIPVATAEDGCTPCPITGDCPRQSIQPSGADTTECPCPKTGECPRNGLIFETFNEAIRISGGMPLVSLQGTSIGSWAEQSIPAEFLQFAKPQGDLIGIPVGVAQANVMWFSQTALNKLGVSAPTSVDELRETMRKAKDQGIIPIAVGGDGGGWQLVQLFKTILAAQSVEVYRRVVIDHDASGLDSNEFRSAAAIFRDLMEQADDGAPNRSWYDTTALVANGGALFQVTGTWAVKEFQSWGQSDGVLCAPFPGQPAVLVTPPTMYGLSPKDGGTVDASELEFVQTEAFRNSFAHSNGLLPVSASSSGTDLLTACVSPQTPIERPLEAAVAKNLALMVPSPSSNGYRYSQGVDDQLSQFAFDPNMSIDTLASNIKYLSED